MARFYSITEQRPNGKYIVHLVELALDVPGGYYRQSKSFNAFFELRGKRPVTEEEWKSENMFKSSWCRCGPSIFDIKMPGLDFHELREEIKIWDHLKNAKVKYHYNLWDFYRHINWDWKIHKYV